MQDITFLRGKKVVPKLIMHASIVIKAIKNSNDIPAARRYATFFENQAKKLRSWAGESNRTRIAARPLEDRINAARAALDQDPDITCRKLAQDADIALVTAAKYKRIYRLRRGLPASKLGRPANKLAPKAEVECY